MISNYLFRLLFDYRGTITRREYWAGLVVVLMCISIIITATAQSTILTTIMFRLKGVEFGSAYALISPILNISFPFGVPFSFIGLYISLILTVKRCRTLSISTTNAILMGLFTYLIFPCTYGSFYAIVGTESIFRYYTVSMTSVIIALIIIVFIGITSILYISSKTSNKDEYSVYQRFDSIRCLFAIAKLMLLAYLAGIFIYYYNQYHYTEAIIYIALAICILAYLFIYIKRGNDAGIKASLILSIFAGFILLYGSIIYSMYAHISSPVLFSLCNIILNLLSNAIYLATFVLIALPSKGTDSNL